jgi:hypothetical protein
LLRGKGGEDLGDHDWPVHAGGSFARTKDLLDRVSKALGSVLLVFIFEAARVFAGITGASPVRLTGGLARGALGGVGGRDIHARGRVMQKSSTRQRH